MSRSLLLTTAAAIPIKEGIVFGTNRNLFTLLIFDRKKHITQIYKIRSTYQKFAIYFTSDIFSADIIPNKEKIAIQPVEIVDGKNIKSSWNFLNAKQILRKYIKSKMVEHIKRVERKI
jgi:hypothetical protein